MAAESVDSEVLARARVEYDSVGQSKLKTKGDGKGMLCLFVAPLCITYVSFAQATTKVMAKAAKATTRVMVTTKVDNYYACAHVTCIKF